MTQKMQKMHDQKTSNSLPTLLNHGNDYILSDGVGFRAFETNSYGHWSA